MRLAIARQLDAPLRSWESGSQMSGLHVPAVIRQRQSRSGLGATGSRPLLSPKRRSSCPDAAQRALRRSARLAGQKATHPPRLQAEAGGRRPVVPNERG